MKSVTGWDIRLCALSAPAATVLFVLALLVAMRFVPPIPPSLGAPAIASLFRTHAVGIEIGATLMVLASTLLLPFTAAITAVLEHMDEPPRALAHTQQLAGVLAFAPLMYSSFFFAAAAFRPDRADDLILGMSDLGWIFLVMTPGAIQPFAIAAAILLDRSAQPLLPRWVAYLNLWFGLLFAGGVLNPLFKHGPLAWNGIIAFWIPAGIFSIWVFAMFWALLRAANLLEQRLASATQPVLAPYPS